MKSSVALCIFRRPATTERVFAQIAKAKPPKLFVIADGPRHGKPGEEEQCAAARAIIDRVDWDCRVFKNYSDANLGCRKRVSTGLDRVFETVDRAIILEDDIVPHPTFFRFCDELLEKYANDNRIGSVAGTNRLGGVRRTRCSYFFTRLAPIWGWATWSRAWKQYDDAMELWPTVRDGEFFRSFWWNGYGFHHLQDLMERAYQEEEDSWAYRWIFSCRQNNMLSIMPVVNLTTNIGFGPDATHCLEESPLANVQTEAMEFPLVHNPLIMPDVIAETLTVESGGDIPRVRFTLDGFRRRRLWLRNKVRSLRGNMRKAARLIKAGQFGELAAKAKRKLLA